MVESEPAPRHDRSPRWLTELVLLAAILTLAMALFHGLDGRYALDCDDKNLAWCVSYRPPLPSTVSVPFRRTVYSRQRPSPVVGTTGAFA